MPTPQFTTRLSDLESRLAHLESDVRMLLQHAGLSTPIEPPAPPPRPEPVLPPPLPPLVMRADLPRAFQPIMPPAPSIDEEPPPPPQATSYKPPSTPHVSLEARIGKNLAGWVGAIVLVLGVGFFLKYAATHGWIHPTPTTRLITSLLAGLSLTAIGEWLLRKPMRGLAAVLYATGVATIMTSFFAAHSYFSPPLLGTTPASLFVLATAAGGIALALRANLPAMAILSLLGAYLSPLILHTDQDQSLTFLSYLLLLSATGWTLCLLRPQWNSLRCFTFAASYAWYTLWSFQRGPHHTDLALAYLSLTYAGTLAELFLTLHAGVERSGTPRSAAPDSSFSKLESTLSLLSLINTLLTAAALYNLYRNNQPLAGSLALGLAAIQSLVALSTPAKPLRYSALLQSTALITLAVPLLLSHFTINLAWLVMALALAILNRRLDLRWPRPWATLLWLLTVAKLVTLDFFNPTLRATLLTIGTQPLTHWLLIAWTAALTAHALAFLSPHPPSPHPPTSPSLDPLGTLLASCGTLLFLLSTAATWGAGPAATLASLLCLTAIVGLKQQGGRIAYPAHATALLLALVFKWFFLDNLLPTFTAYDHPATDLAPLVNLPTLCALLLATLAIFHLRRRAIALIAFLAFAFLNFELLRSVNHFASTQSLADLQIAKQVSLSIFWALTSLAAITAGLTRKLTPARYAGLTLLGLTLLKVLTLDLAGVETLWRICSFTAVGALLMCVSFVYYKHFEGKPITVD